MDTAPLTIDPHAWADEFNKRLGRHVTVDHDFLVAWHDEAFRAATSWFDSDLFAEVIAERVRQETKFPNQHLPSVLPFDADPHDPSRSAASTAALAEQIAKRTVASRVANGTLTWRDVLAEEVAEAVAAVYFDQAALRAELIQVAAVALRWAADLPNP